MKTTTTIITFLFIILSNLSFAQTTCEIPNGSFETWIDVTEDFDDTGLLPAGTIMLPDNVFGLFRFFVSTIIEIFEAIGGEEISDEFINASAMFFGLYQSMDATDGEFSLQMQSDSIFSFADAIITAPCLEEELPTSFCFDLKHVGGGADTFSIIGVFDEEATLAFDDYGFSDASAFFILDSIVLEGDSEWTSYNIPVVDNMNGISPDTAMIVMFLTSNEDSIAMGVESYYLVDNLNFKLEGVLPLATTAFTGEYKKTYNNISWSVLNEENLSHYILERSYGDLEDWQEINRLNINPNGASHYSYHDMDIEKRGIYYYRIRQLDLNGYESLSQVIQVDVPMVGHLSIVSYPNPVREQLNIDIFLSEASENISYTLFSADGKQFKLNAELPEYLDAGLHNFSINLAHMPSGIYNLVIESKFTEVRKRIIVSK